MQDLIEGWNKSHSKIPSEKEVSEYAVEVERQFPRGSVVCDVGGGMGVDTLHFLLNGHQVTNIDISDYALDKAKEKATKAGYNLTTKQIDLGKKPLPLEDASQDVVYSRLSLHYFNKEATIDVLKEIYRVLKPGGRIYLTVKSSDDAKEMAFLRQTAKEIEPNVFEDADGIKSRYTVKQWEDMLRMAKIKNFEVLDYVERLDVSRDRIKSGLDRFLLTEIRITK